MPLDPGDGERLVATLRDRGETVVLTDEDVRALLALPACIEQQALAFREVSAGRVLSAPRARLAIAEDRSSSVMTGWVPAVDALGCKMLARSLGNAARGLPALLGTIVLVDPLTAVPLAVMSATYLTNARTAAAAALAARVLGRGDPGRVGVYGTGAVARLMLEAVVAVSRPRRVAVYSPSPDHRRRYAEEMSRHLAIDVAAVDDASEPATADLVLAATTSRTPVLEASRLRPGATVISIAAWLRELPVEAFRGHRLVVDSREAARHEAGDLVAAIEAGVLDPSAFAVELGEILLDRAPGRERADQICVFKSVGLPAQDLVTARAVLEAALAAGAGVRVVMHGAGR